MEEHRLTPMKPDYDVRVFEQILADTKGLRQKLARGIDPNKYGVEYEDILSWFNTKFIFIFNKYYGETDNNILKGKIIQGLQVFKNRILRYGYTHKNSVNQTSDIEDFLNIESYEQTVVEDPGDFERLCAIFRKELDGLAYRMFVIDHRPPLYIVERNNSSTKRIPESLVCDFLGVDKTERAYQEIRNARKQYRTLISSLIEQRK